MSGNQIRLTVLGTEHYFREATALLAGAKKHQTVSIITMGFDPTEPRVDAFLQALAQAGRRGANAVLAIDAHDFLVNRTTGLPNGSLGAQLDIAAMRRGRRKTLAQRLLALREAGVDVTIINKPKTTIANPKAGRCHIKATCVGDDVFIGGCNLNGSDKIDLMVHAKSPALAAYTHGTIRDIAKAGHTQVALRFRDQELCLGDHTSLFIDSGAPEQSLIFAEACKLIDQAQEWIVMTCQYFPYGATARHLAAASARGVKVRLHYGHPTHHEPIQVLGHRLVIWQQKTRHPKELFDLQLNKDSPKLHAKLIATEQGAIIGSHNYVTAGIRMGTAEAAILRLDPDFALQAVKALQTQQLL